MKKNNTIKKHHTSFLKTSKELIKNEAKNIFLIKMNIIFKEITLKNRSYITFISIQVIKYLVISIVISILND